MLARELIDRLERRGLLDQEIVEALRQQLEESRARVTPEAVAKLLVDNGHLTKFQATKLIGELRSEEYGSEEPAAASRDEAEDELGFADEGQPSEPLEAEAEPDSAPDAAPVAAHILLENEDEVLEAEPIEAEPIEAEPIEAEAIEAEAIDPFAQAAPQRSRAARAAGVAKAKRKEPRQGAPQNQWDSFKIYGVASILALLLVAGVWLYYSLSKGNAADYLQRADEFYSQQQYSRAINSYEYFLKNFDAEGENGSLARVRIVLADLFDTRQSATDPTRVLEKAQERLPEIENEPALQDNRADLAGFLIDVAEQIAARADAAESTDAKAALIERLDEQIELVQNPTYITTSLRHSLENRINAVTEDRARVVRDIDRQRRLSEAVSQIRAALAEQDTRTAYEIRRQLIREYPRLYDHPELDELVIAASEIQRELVHSDGEPLPVTSEPSGTELQRDIVLANRVGGTIGELEGQVHYVRARGSILALAADDGRLLWRRFVGYQDENAPVPLGEMPGDGVLLSDGERQEIQRLSGADGQLEWRATVGAPFSEPVVMDESVYLSAEDGRVAALAAEDGRTRWVTTIPQPLEVKPGLARRESLLYQPGDHSNLYVLKTTDGSCVESHYIGHQPGAVAVPPILLLGHLFVIDNAADDYALVHILRTDDSGRNLKPAQANIRLVGNVVTPPEVVGRRLVILTDRGQVVVLDVEPSAEGDQVSQVAELVASNSRPVHSRMAVDRGQMWVTGNRIARYQLQINTGRVLRDWVKQEGDTFVATPRQMGPALVTARVVRDTQGIRVSAAEPRTGEEIWRTDVGVPTAMVAEDPGGPSIFAVTSQGALYQLDREAVASQATTGPVENPGGSGRAMRFAHPVAVDEVRQVLWNTATPGQIALFDPSREREKLRLVTLALPAGQPTAAPISAGGGLLIPLDSGRIVLMDWQTGGSLASPFQPPLAPGQRVQWTQPARLPEDADQVLIANDQRKIYRLRAAEQLRSLAEGELQYKPLGSVAAAGEVVVVGGEGAAGDVLEVLESQSLKPRTAILLDEKILWGPVAWDDQILVGLDSGTLRCYEPTGEICWQSELPGGMPVGPPLRLADTLLLTGQQGWLLAVDPATGSTTGMTAIDQPIGGQPIVYGGRRLLVPGAEGTVYVTDLPTSPTD